MKRILFPLLLSALLFPLFSPLVALAQGPPPSSIIPCGFDTNGDKKVTGSEACTFNRLIILAQNVINFLIFKIAAPLSAVMFAYAGFLYVTNHGNEGQVKKAHDIFLAVFLGLVVCLAAWLIVYLVVNFFLDPSFVLLSAPT